MTRQTIETMKANAVDWNKHELVVVFDGTQAESFGPNYPSWFAGPIVSPSSDSQMGVGAAKNCGALWFKTQSKPKPDDILMFTDCDMYYLPGWDEQLENILQSSVTQLGGWKHPYHKFTSKGHTAGEVDAVTGNCFVIRWADWLKYGPFYSNAIGPGQSEDYALSQKIKAAGGIVATLDPPVAIHVGLANCLGEPATGWEEMSKMAEQQIKDYGIDKIWLATPDEGTVLIEKCPAYCEGFPTWIKTEDPPNSGRFTLAVGNRLCLGSGQKRFDNNHGWINIDTQNVPPDRVPDIVCDFTKEPLPFEDNSIITIVAEHCIEHVGCGEATAMLQECWRVLQPGGSLIITAPDMRALAGRWLGGELSTQLYMTNVYGAYMGNEADRHRWGGDYESWLVSISQTLPNAFTQPFDWRVIPGASIAKDFWILGIEVIK